MKKALLAELASRAPHSRASIPKLQPRSRRDDTAEDQDQIKVGDKVLLLTRGTRCRKGDTATVTKVGANTVYFTIHRNGHSTYKLAHNVEKIAPSTQT